MPKRTISDYCASNPVPQSHQKAGEKTAMKRDPMSAGWAWNPPEDVERALKRGARKIRKAKAAELEEAKMATNKSASKKKVTKKAKAKKASTRKAPAKKVAKKVAKKTTGNRIPLKKLCQELKLDPKMARRKLRAAGLSGHDPKARWDFTAAQATKAKAILSK
jgi:hypothetical protein